MLATRSSYPAPSPAHPPTPPPPPTCLPACLPTCLCVPPTEREELEQQAQEEAEEEEMRGEMMDSPAKRQRLEEGAARRHRWVGGGVGSAFDQLEIPQEQQQQSTSHKTAVSPALLQSHVGKNVILV